MKVYKTQAEVEKDIVDGVLRIEGNVAFECDISIEANIKAWDINAGNIKAGNIKAGDINARDINARDIKARDIKARDISYYAFCNVYEGVECISIKGRRIPHSKPICLDGELIIKKVEVKEYSMDEIAKALGVDVRDLKVKKG